MFIKTNDRLEVIKSLFNQALQDNTLYCNNCDKDFDGTGCCDDPHIGSNFTVMRDLAFENELVRNSMKYDTGKTEETGAMRMSFRIPPRIYHFISNYFKGYNEKFPQDNRELHRLMKELKPLCTVRKV